MRGCLTLENWGMGNSGSISMVRLVKDEGKKERR